MNNKEHRKQAVIIRLAKHNLALRENACITNQYIMSGTRSGFKLKEVIENEIEMDFLQKYTDYTSKNDLDDIDDEAKSLAINKFVKNNTHIMIPSSFSRYFI